MTLKQERQKEFNTVYNYYKNGGKPGVDVEGGCCYLTEEGGMCAIGVLIENCGMSRAGRETLGTYVYNMSDDLREQLGLRDDKSFYSDLQRRHDGNMTNEFCWSGFTSSFGGVRV